MDSGSKPWEAFSLLEMERYFGETTDVYTEALEIKTNAELLDRANHINHVVTGILKKYLADGILDRDSIVVNTVHQPAAQLVANVFRLNLCVHPDIPTNEVGIVRFNDVETYIKSRVYKAKGFIPSTLVVGMVAHRR